MYHIERALRYLKQMVDNGARVEWCITEAFTLEVAYFSSVYFAEEHNGNAPMMRYNVDEEPPSDLSIFASKSTTVGSSTSNYSTS
jgi:hypothetical protein